MSMWIGNLIVLAAELCYNRILPLLLSCAGLWCAVRTLPRQLKFLPAGLRSFRCAGRQLLRPASASAAAHFSGGGVLIIAAAAAAGGYGALVWTMGFFFLFFCLFLAEAALLRKHRGADGAARWICGIFRSRWAGRTAAILLAAGYGCGLSAVQGSLLRDALAACLPNSAGSGPLLAGFLLLAAAFFLFGGASRCRRAVFALTPAACALYIGLGVWAAAKEGSLLPAVLAGMLEEALSLPAFLAGAGGACLLYISGPGAGLAAWAAETAADSRPAGQGILPAAVSAAMVFLTGVSTFLIVGLSGLSPSAFSSPLELLLESARYLFGGAGLSLAAGCLTALCFSAGLCACAYAEVGLSLLTPSRRGRTAVRLCCLSSLLAGALSPEPAPWTIFLCPLVPLVLLRTAAVLRRCGDAIPKYPFKNP